MYAEFIRDKSHESIIPIICNHVQQGATIHSDGANVYKCLGNMHFTHRTVIHEQHFVDSNTGVHTNSIENIWSNLKMCLKSIRGSQLQMLVTLTNTYIGTIEKSEGNLFQLMINDIADQYPV